jgi:hypothetical protein
MHTTTAGAEERLITRNSRGGNNITWAKEEWAGPGVQDLTGLGDRASEVNGIHIRFFYLLLVLSLSLLLVNDDHLILANYFPNLLTQ